MCGLYEYDLIRSTGKLRFARGTHENLIYLPRPPAADTGNPVTNKLEQKNMNNEIIFLIEESIEGGYEAKALSHSIYTEADTFEELKEMIKDAVQCHFDEKERPKIIRLHFVREEIIAA